MHNGRRHTDCRARHRYSRFRTRSSTAFSTTSPTVLSLPDEVLDRIFDNIADSPREPLFPYLCICRRLSRLVHAQLYRRIFDFTLSDDTLYFLIDTFENEPSLFRLIEQVSLQSYAVRTPEFRASYLRSLLRKACGLRVLELNGYSARLVPEILLLLPNPPLAAVDFMLSFRDNDDDDLRSLWHGLQRFRSLPRGDIHGPNEWAPRGGPIRPYDSASPTTVPLESVRTLRVNTYFWTRAFGPAASVNDLLPNLVNLTLDISYTPDAFNLERFLSTLPLTLKRLSFLFNSCSSHVPDPKSAFKLATLPPQLERLELQANLFSTEDLLAYLPTSQLQTIRFDWGCLVTDKVVDALVNPAIRPRTLRRVTLDHIEDFTSDCIEDAIGWATEALGEGESVDYDALRAEKGPSWPEGGTEDGLRSALVVAAASDLQVEGSALQRIG
ncbi:hypothetical protein JCM10908_006256 [Rhodotorula pacifica]|uniref:uncharacterized protein n=1 Tax=Rhodotorula pacifica TaxID=1495444 RepID=UPI00317615F5